MIKTIIFDWSGVISDELDADVATTNDILEARGYPKISKEKFLELYELPWENFYKKQGIPVEMKEENARWSKIFPKHYSKLRLFPHAKEVLECLKNRGKKIVVLSSHNADLLEEEIELFGLRGLIDAVDASNSDKRGKIDAFLKEHGINKRETVFVGDTSHDIETAKFAGIKSIAVLSGFGTKESLEKQKPDYLIEKISELPELVERIEAEEIEKVETKETNGKKAHVVVVALAEIEKKLVMLERAYPIKCTSLIIGHIAKGENENSALEREVLEETGGKIEKKEFLGERVFDYGWKCTRGANLHAWRVYRVHIDKLRKKEIDEGKLLLVPFEKIQEQNITETVKKTLEEFGYIK